MAFRRNDHIAGVCGITGILGFEPADERALHCMAKVLQHGYPGSAGTWIDGSGRMHQAQFKRDMTKGLLILLELNELNFGKAVIYI